jgi:uncharacterized protein YjbI with pentapeptide repeats
MTLDESKDSIFAGIFSALLHIAVLCALFESSSSREFQIGGGRTSGDEKNAQLHSQIEATFRQKILIVPAATQRSGTLLSEVPIASKDSSSAAESTDAAAEENDDPSGAGDTIEESNGEEKEDLTSSYLAALRGAILRNWRKPGASLDGCVMQLEQKVGGDVLQAKVTGCSMEAESLNSLEAAALIAQPLPYSGYEASFIERLNLELER